MILKIMTTFFGNAIQYLDDIPSTESDKNIEEKYFSNLENIAREYYSYIKYKELYSFLDELPYYLESYEEIANPDFADEIGVENPEISESNTMCKKGEFEGFKILIGQFWDYTLLEEKESHWVDKKYLSERYDKNKECLKEVLEYYKMEIVIKDDYEQCILELQTGKYIEHWIICGNGGGKLPNGGNANLVGQYIEALKIYWTHGGSIVFWNDNEPYTYECNLFLKQAEFPGDVTKTEVRFGGEHKGKSIMEPGDIKQEFIGIREKGIFNGNRIFNDGKNSMFSLGHNLVKIAEGTTISYAQDSEKNTIIYTDNSEEFDKKIYPFYTFGYEHEGGMNILFYIPPHNKTHGYLVLEGGFTKLFNELDSDGTKRYILNIAAFCTQFTKRIAEGENWKTDFKIEPFKFDIDKDVIWDEFNSFISNEFDIVYLIDATGSMGSYLAAARDQCIAISNKLKEELPKFKFQFGAVFYRDPIDCPGDKNIAYSLKDDVSSLKKELASETATGGGDEPEDWVGAYDMACDNIAWRNGTRLIIHIADAPAHGSEWCGTYNHDDENSKLYPIIQKCVDKNIKIIGFQIGSSPEDCFIKFKKEYDSKGGHFCQIKKFEIGLSSDKISEHLRDMVVESAHSAAPK